MLGITDKAISKWERGIACPDISLLPKLSVILDTDIDSLLYGLPNLHNQRWKGVLVTDDESAVEVYGKPLVYFLLSNYLLVGIKDILVVGVGCEKLLKDGSQWGVNFTYDNCELGKALLSHPSYLENSTMLVYGNHLLYGAGLTRRYQALMSNEDGATNIVSFSGECVPITLCTSNGWKDVYSAIEKWRNGCDARKSFYKVFLQERKLDRGTVFLPITTIDEHLEAARFMQFIKNTQRDSISDLHEIAISRGLISENN